MSLDKAQEWLDTFRSQALTNDLAISPGEKVVKKAKTIAFTSGKGGVGKTTLSLKFSKDLAFQGNKVLLIDCDFNLSNTLIKLNLPLNDNFYSLISFRKDFNDCLHKEGNFHLLSGCNGHVDLFEHSGDFEKIVLDIIKSHENDYDYIIIDSPAGAAQGIMTINAYCDHRIFIVNPDRSSITDSYSVMKILSQKFGIKENHLLVNKYLENKEFKKVVKTLSETAENFLNARTIVLGGLKYMKDKGDRFEQDLLYRENSAAHLNFSKVMDSFSEKIVGTRRQSH